MPYSTDASKWRAYQFKDPFATGSFIVCNKVNKHFCHPDCDAFPTTELRSEIKFVVSPAEALNMGYIPCKSCDPLVAPAVDVSVLLRTVRKINASIGFIPPLLEDDEEKVSETIKESIIGHGAQRRMSVPTTTAGNKLAADKSGFSVSKNDSEHYRLIDLACRHLASAAASSIYGTKSNDGSKKKASKKRRGGVLGFKELATKSKLSAWHFHRVFKSIIGLTPKTYGDMCWEHLEKEKDAMVSPSSDDNLSAVATPLVAGAPIPAVAAAEAYMTPKPSTAMTSPISGQKRVRIYDDDEPSPKRGTSYVDVTALSPFDLQDDKSLMNMASRATSVPNLTAYGNATNSLFQHSRMFDPYLGRDMGLPEQDNVPGYSGLAEFSPHEQLSSLNLAPEYSMNAPDVASSLTLSNSISPETLSTDISPLTNSEVPDVSLSMFDVNDVPQDFAEVGVPEIDWSVSGVLDTKPKDEFVPELSANDPMMAGLAPELLMSNVGL